MRWLAIVLLLASCGGPVPDEIILRPIGRVSEPSHNLAPPGSLLTAENCVMRAPGVLSPLPPLRQVSNGSPPVSNTLAHQSPLLTRGAGPSQLVYVERLSGSIPEGIRASHALHTERQYRDYSGSLTRIKYFSTPNNFLVRHPFWLSRGGLYLSDRSGVYKWADTDETELEQIRDASGGVFATMDASGTWLPDGSHVKYKTVLVFKSEGIERRTAPSVGFRANNTAGGPRAVDVEVYVENSDFYGSLTSVEVYRSRTFDNTVQIPNEYYLVRSIDVSEFIPHSAGQFQVESFIDDVSPSDLSASLYTNTSQDGQIGANVAPPSSIYHAHFRGHEFWGDVAEKEFFPELRRLDDTDITHTMVGASASMGSNQITVSGGDLDGARVGMIVIADGILPVGTYITAIDGVGPDWTITISDNALANGAVETVYDTIYILWGDGSTSRFRAAPAQIDAVDRNLANIFTAQSKFNGDHIPWFWSLVLASKHRSARMGPAQIWISYPNLYDQNEDWAALNTGTGEPISGGTEALPALHRTRLYYSKLDEPEHTTLTSFVDMDETIVGLGALKDALIILTTGGAHRLTGVNGNFRVDPIDTSIGFIGGASVQVMDGAVYALSSRGLVRITAQGVDNLSDGIVGDWFREEPEQGNNPRLAHIVWLQGTNDDYAPPSVFAAADPAHREYALMAGPDPNSFGVQDELLVFNAKTSAFTTWRLNGSNDQPRPIGSLGYVKGDYLFGGIGAYESSIVLGVSDETSPFDSALYVMDDREGLKPYTDNAQDVRFRARIEGDPTHLKMWTELAWDLDGQAATLEAVFQDESSPSVTQEVSNFAGDKEIRIWPPRDVVRSTKLVPGLTGTGITVYGLRLSFVSSGKRVPQ